MIRAWEDEKRRGNDDTGQNERYPKDPSPTNICRQDSTQDKTNTGLMSVEESEVGGV